MLSISLRSGRIAAVCVALAAVTAPGCRPDLEQSQRAAELPILALDPAEDAGGEGNWPQWRGPNSQGISPDMNVPVQWSATDGVLWSVEIPGRGNSSPVVWDDSILLTTAVQHEGGARLELLCYHRHGGDLQWRAELGTAEETTHAKNGYASATPATDGEAVYTCGGGAGLFCHDLDGRPRWHVPLDGLEHGWGTASSPVLFGGMVIQLCDGRDESFLAAFDRQTGRQVWRTERDSQGCWTTPVIVQAETPDGTRSELIVNGTGAGGSGKGWVIAYQPASGRELWRLQGTTDVVCPTAMAGGSLVFSTSGRNGPVIAIRPGGQGDVTAEHVWKTRRGGPYVPTGVVYRNRLYTVGDAGVVTCYNAGSGDPLWQERLRGKFTASLIAAAGRIYATAEHGDVYVISAGDQFKLLATNTMSARCLATPAVSRGDLLLRTEQRLYCIARSPADEAVIAIEPSAAAQVDPAQTLAEDASPSDSVADPSPSDAAPDGPFVSPATADGINPPQRKLAD